jgi:hypothetical protein
MLPNKNIKHPLVCTKLQGKFFTITCELTEQSRSTASKNLHICILHIYISIMMMMMMIIPIMPLLDTIDRKNQYTASSAYSGTKHYEETNTPVCITQR